MKRRYVDVSTAKVRLQELPNLAAVLGDDWLDQEYTKPVEHWSQVTGWLSSWEIGKPQNEAFVSWVKDLDAALGYLEKRASPRAWTTIARKIRSHSDRSETLGTLSELAMCVFLASNNMPFDLETQLLVKNHTNVDVRVYPDCDQPVHIEVQWVSPSDRSERGSIVAARYGGAYAYWFDYEGVRIKQKVYDKTRKFTSGDTTLVALNYTLCPELVDVGRTVVLEAFTGHDLEGDPTAYANSAIDTSIRQLVDGVFWFTLTSGRGLFPVGRGALLNSKSHASDGNQLPKFLQSWKSDETSKMALIINP